jgi:hypothetical protein
MIKGQLERIYKFNNWLNIKMEMHMSINLYISNLYEIDFLREKKN